MKHLLWLSLAAVALAMPAAAATVTRDAAALQSSRIQQREAAHRATAAHHDGRVSYALGQGFGGENGPYANPYRTYPPSCMADPLPATPSGPIWTMNMDMASYNQSLGGYVREPVKITIWRVPCSSSTRARAITLVRLQRLGTMDGNTSQYVAFPGIRVAQGSIGFDDPNGWDQPRLALEPNTIISASSVDSAVVDSTTWVLEDYPLSDRPAFDYTQAFNIRFDNFISDGKPRQYVIGVPAYQPTESSYPTAFQPIPISGYVSNNWYDRTHSGEGMMIQVYEQQDVGMMDLQFNWFTFGPDGRPFWISGDAQFQPGARQVTVPVAGYRDGGGFAGNFGAKTNSYAWGTVTFQFDTCDQVSFSYQSNANLPAWVPQGSGARVWNRLATVNGIPCE